MKKNISINGFWESDAVAIFKSEIVDLPFNPIFSIAFSLASKKRDFSLFRMQKKGALIRRSLHLFILIRLICYLITRVVKAMPFPDNLTR